MPSYTLTIPEPKQVQVSINRAGEFVVDIVGRGQMLDKLTFRPHPTHGVQLYKQTFANGVEIQQDEVETARPAVSDTLQPAGLPENTPEPPEAPQRSNDGRSTYRPPIRSVRWGR